MHRCLGCLSLLRFYLHNYLNKCRCKARHNPFIQFNSVTNYIEEEMASQHSMSDESNAICSRINKRNFIWFQRTFLGFGFLSNFHGLGPEHAMEMSPSSEWVEWIAIWSNRRTNKLNLFLKKVRDARVSGRLLLRMLTRVPATEITLQLKKPSFNFKFYFPDCEKSLENVPSNVYDSVCGTEISEYIGNQRLQSNSQDYSTDKSYSSIPNGKFTTIFA